MAVAYFDTLNYVNTLTKANFTKEQAEALNKAQMMASNVLFEQLATKSEMKTEFAAVRSEMKDLENRLKLDMLEMEGRIKDVVYRAVTYSIAINVALITIAMALAETVLK